MVSNHRLIRTIVSRSRGFNNSVLSLQAMTFDYRLQFADYTHFSLFSFLLFVCIRALYDKWSDKITPYRLKIVEFRPKLYCMQIEETERVSSWLVQDEIPCILI